MLTKLGILKQCPFNNSSHISGCEGFLCLSLRGQCFGHKVFKTDQALLSCSCNSVLSHPIFSYVIFTRKLSHREGSTSSSFVDVYLQILNVYSLENFSNNSSKIFDLWSKIFFSKIQSRPIIKIPFCWALIINVSFNVFKNWFF